MGETIWKSKGTATFPGTIEKFFKNQGLVSEEGEILDIGRLIDFGIFSFFVWYLPYKRNFYRSYFDLYITGLNEKQILFLLATEKDRFSYPNKYLVIQDPLDFLPRGNGDHANCPINHIISYNCQYVSTNKGITLSLPDPLSSCEAHKNKIRETAIHNDIFPLVFGGWPVSLDINPELIHEIEFDEKNNREALFNEFLSLYFKYKLNANDAHSNAELKEPFFSHEVDACIISNNTLILLETSAEFELKDDNIKKKIYNLWSLEKIYDKSIMLYLTFGKDKKIGNNLKSFLDYYEDSKNPHFEIMHFPEFFKFLDRPLKQIKSLDDLVEMQKGIEEEFKAFLDQIEEKINVFITND